MHMSRSPRVVAAVGAVASLVLAAGALGAAGPGGQSRHQAGKVLGAGGPVQDATVRLFCAGVARRAGATVLGTAQTDAKGEFRIEFAQPTGPNAVLYLVAEGHLGDLKFATVLGADSVSPGVCINERTTIATAYTMAQFIDDDVIGGYPIGVRNAALVFRNLVDPVSGRPAKFLQQKPNGTETSTLRKFNSLANILAACSESALVCPVLFDFTTPVGGPAPTNTLEAAINIAHDPAHNFAELWVLSRVSQSCQPAIAVPPPDWTLAIKYVGNGKQFSGPGACAFDEQGNAWINNNYTPRRNRFLRACGSHLVTKFSPAGENLDGSPFIGGGVDGAGFGICVDRSGDAWIGNFGFYGRTCPEDLQPAANSVSQFMPDGTAVSPPIIGWTEGNISSPQATVSDQMGNIWIANSCNGTVTQYRGGNPHSHWNTALVPGDCSQGAVPRPFGIAIDHDGNGWVTDNVSDAVYQLDTDGTVINGPICGDETGLVAPMGVAIDSLGNIWVSNSGIVHVPCPQDGLEFPNYGSLIPDPEHASVTRLNPDGTVGGVHKGAGLFIPWGIAVDGDDHVWVANFGQQRVSKLCGANPETCPIGMSAGDPLSPENGYQFDGLVRNTGVAIDPSGNVWLANNWFEIPIQTNPGGDGVVVFIGLAGPVVTPLLGPVVSP